MVPWEDDEEAEEEEFLKCGTCEGTGNCPRCNGKGVRWSTADCEPTECNLCGGDGECWDCGGSGLR